MKAEILRAVLRARADKVPAALVTDIESGAQTLVAPDAPAGDVALGDELEQAVEEALAADRGISLDVAGRRYFIQVFNPPRRLAVVGAVHIAQALAPMAALAGYAVTVVDPRGAFATESRFPGVTLNTDWPDDALAALNIDRRTAVVTLTHDPKLDDPALQAALAGDAFYVGALGSRRTHGRRLERLREAGVPEEALERIHGPVGLDIGARSPEEIAVSVLAQVVERLRLGDGA